MLSSRRRANSSKKCLRALPGIPAADPIQQPSRASHVELKCVSRLALSHRERDWGLAKANRRARSRRSRYPYHHGQLCHSRNGDDQNPAGAPAALSCALHANTGAVEIRPSAGLPNSPGSKSAAAAIPRRSSWKRIFAPSSSGTMKIPSRSDGPNPQRKSSRPSNAFATGPSRLHATDLDSHDCRVSSGLIPAARCAAAPYRENFLYLSRCGRMLSIPKRRFLSSS